MKTRDKVNAAKLTAACPQCGNTRQFAARMRKDGSLVWECQCCCSTSTPEQIEASEARINRRRPVVAGHVRDL